MLQGTNRLVFVVGGAYGVNAEMKKKVLDLAENDSLRILAAVYLTPTETTEEEGKPVEVSDGVTITDIIEHTSDVRKDIPKKDTQ